MGEDVLFREEIETIQEAVEVLEGERTDDFSWRHSYEKLLDRYKKLFSHGKRLTRIGDLMQNELNRLNQQLTEANEFQAQLLSTAPTGIVTVDSNQLVTKVGDAFALMTGVDRDRLVGKRFEDLGIAPAGKAGDEIPSSGPDPVFGAECTMRRADGHVLRLLANSAPLRDALGNVIGRIIAFADVTELIEAREAARAADEAKSQFLARMSHEIRTPMNAILGFTEVILEENISEVQRDALTAVERGGKRLLALLNDVLDFSKIEADKMELLSKVLDLESMVFDAIEMARPIAEKKRLELLCDIPAFPWELIGDPTRLQQILGNLLSNAVKFTQRGEVVTTIRTPVETEDRVKVSISVTDTGVGIPEDKLDSIFETFSQADGSATRRFGGTGLGLAICRRLVQLMDGSISVKSSLGEGSRFDVDIWLDKGNTRHEQADRRPHGIAFAEASVLIVDDNPTSLDILEAMCRRLGITPVCQSSPDPASKDLINGNYDVILIDAEMSEREPRLDAVKLKERFKRASPTIIALTSDTRRHRALSGHGSMFDDALLKPVRMSALIKMLEATRNGGQRTADGQRGLTKHPVRGTRRRILLAEDDLLCQKLAIWILTRLGHETDLAEDGRGAIEMAREESYDLILMDVHMPHVDGGQAARKLRDLGLTTPIVGVSAAVMAEDRERCIEAGMNDYISKPVSPKTLTNVLEKWLPEESSQHESQIVEEAKPCAQPIWDKAGMLERLLGDEEMATKIAMLFLDDVPPRIQALRQSLESGDVKKAEREVHNIMASSANVGGECLREAASAVEKAAKAEDASAALTLMGELETQFDLLGEEMIKGVPKDETSLQ